MWNIIKSQWYQTVRDRRVRGVFLVTILFNVAITFANLDGWEGNLKSSAITADMSSFYGVMGLIFMLALTAFVMGTDFVDRTLNYEILAGHSRGEVFWGRFVVAALTGSTGALIVMAFCPCLFTVLYGWGNVLHAGGVVLRYALVGVMLLRVACELALIGVILKNPYTVIFVGYIIGCVEFLVLLLKPILLNADILFQILSVCHCSELLSFGVHVNEAGQVAGVSFVEPQAALVTIAGAVIIGAAAATAACMYFKRDDLH